MASFNRVLLIGNLARDPELRHTPQGKAVCEFTLAVDGSSQAGAEKKTHFIPVTAWEKTAEACAKHLAKGSLVHVEGRLQQERWEQEGENRSRLGVVAHSVNFLRTKTKEGGQEGVPVSSSGSGEPEDSESDTFL